LKNTNYCRVSLKTVSIQINNIVNYNCYLLFVSTRSG